MPNKGEEHLIFFILKVTFQLDDARALTMPEHFTNGDANHVANLTPPRPLLFAISGAIVCHHGVNRATAQDVVDHKTRETFKNSWKTRLITRACRPWET